MSLLESHINTLIESVFAGIGFNTEQDIEKYMNDADSCTRTQILAALIVTSPFNNEQLARAVTYKLRPLSEKRIGGRNATPVGDWNTDVSVPGFDFTGPRFVNSSRGGYPG